MGAALYDALNVTFDAIVIFDSLDVTLDLVVIVIVICDAVVR
jgi:hypothetical protein